MHSRSFANLDELNAFYLMQVRTSLSYAKNKSPFYKKFFQDHKIDVEQINSMQDFEKIPCTEKKHLSENELQFLCVSNKEIADWCTTSGTSGKPVSFGLSKSDIARLAKNEARSLIKMDCNSETTVQLMVTLDKRFMAGLAYYLGIKEIGASCIRVGSGSPGLQLDSIQRFKPEIIIAVPSFLLKVIQYADKHNIDYRNSSVKKILCIGEPIRNENLELNSLGSRILSAWPELKLFSTYASTEMSTAITECASGQGGHIPPELVYIEVLDKNNKPQKEGIPGEVCFTTFGVEAMPLIRYKTGDIAIMNRKQCSCGSWNSRLSPILGRKKNMLKFKGTTIFPESIFDALNSIEEIQSYQVELSNNEVDLDHVIIYMVTKNNSNNLDQIKESLSAALRVSPQIECISTEEMQKRKFPDGSRKPIKLIDQRKSLSL